MKSIISFIEIETGEGISIHNLMHGLREVVAGAAIENGFLAVTSQHTTTAIAINEDEERLREDVKRFLKRLIPPEDCYLHNDIAARD